MACYYGKGTVYLDGTALMSIPPNYTGVTTVSASVFSMSPPVKEVGKPRITYGPVKKGKGGKVKRW